MRARPLRTGAVVLFIAAVAGPGLVRGQDAISAGTVTGAQPGQTVEVPIYLRDVSGTPLGGDAPFDRRIHGVSVTVLPTPITAVAALEFLRGETTEGRAVIFETQTQAGPARSWIASFVQPLPLTLDAATPGDEIARVAVELAPGVAPGTVVQLTVVGATTAVSNLTATILENTTNGDLTVADGQVGIGVSDLCNPSATVVCLSGQRFKAEVAWVDFEGQPGVGHAVPLTADTGTFWFFSPDNIELVVKVIDGRATNGHFWVFYASLSNVQYTLTLTDEVTGQVGSYFNDAGAFASVGDIEAFLDGGTGLRWPEGAPSPKTPPARPKRAKQGLCTPSPSALCLNGDRFRVEASWEDFGGQNGIGVAVPRTDDSGMFFFFNDQNIELIVKVIDGRDFNGHFWVFYGALSNVEFNLTVTDTETGEVRAFFNPLGTFASVGEIQAFPL